jgi:hypothetical protein
VPRESQSWAFCLIKGHPTSLHLRDLAQTSVALLIAEQGIEIVSYFDGDRAAAYQMFDQLWSLHYTLRKVAQLPDT